MSLTDFVSQIDWDKTFAMLRVWPLNCDDDDIGRQTPRKSFELIQSRNDFFESIFGSGEEEEPKKLPKRREPLEPQEAQKRPWEPIKPLDSQEATQEPEVQPVKAGEPRTATSGDDERGDEDQGPVFPIGLNLESYPCWQTQPGEMSRGVFGGDPFSVSRAVTRERHYTAVMESTKVGRLEQYGVPTENYDAARDFFERSWGENAKLFEIIERVAFDLDYEEGRAVLLKLGKRLQPYALGLARDMTVEEFVVEFQAHLKVCAQRKRERDELQQRDQTHG